MAIDSIRLLTDSAAQIYNRLSPLRPIDGITSSFDEWLGTATPSDYAEEQALRRDYRQLVHLVEEIETLVRSRNRAMELVRERAAQSCEL